MGILAGPAVRLFGGNTSDVPTTPFPHALGTQARDSAGNEYVFCAFAGAVAPEMVVTIDAAYSATAISTTFGKGPIGVVADYGKLGLTSANTSLYATTQGGWVQIYGRAFVMLMVGGAAVAAVSPSDAANGPTTVMTSLQTKFIVATSLSTPAGAVAWVSDTILSSTPFFAIEGMTVATDASLTDVSAVTLVSLTHTGQRVAVWLNYPVIQYVDITS